MAAKDRRDRYYHFDKNYDPLLALNLDEYLIKHHPYLSLKQRKSVWVHCQNDESFDWSAVKAQVDKVAKQYDDNNSGASSSAEVSDSVPLKPKPRRKRNAD